MHRFNFNTEQRDEEPDVVLLEAAGTRDTFAAVDNEEEDYLNKWSNKMGSFVSFQKEQCKEFIKVKRELKKTKDKESQQQAYIKNLETENTNLSGDLFERKQENEKLLQTKTDQQDRIKALNKTIGQLSNELDTKNDQIGDLTTEVATLKNNLIDSEMKRSHVEQQNQEMVQTYAGIYQSIQKFLPGSNLLFSPETSFTTGYSSRETLITPEQGQPGQTNSWTSSSQSSSTSTRKRAVPPQITLGGIYNDADANDSETVIDLDYEDGGGKQLKLSSDTPKNKRIRGKKSSRI